MTTLEQILARPKAPIPVPTPEWPDLDHQLVVRRLTAAERLAFYALAAKEDASTGAAFTTLMATYCAAIDEPIAPGCLARRAFGDEDWRQLATDPGSGSAILRLADAADEVNYLSDYAREQLKKTSAGARPCGDTSGSPASSDAPWPSY